MLGLEQKTVDFIGVEKQKINFFPAIRNYAYVSPVIVTLQIEESHTSSFQALFNKYWPIETNPNMSVDEKTPYIIEWMQAEMKAMRECGKNRQLLFASLESGVWSLESAQ